MAYDGSPIPWTDEQWARIENVIQQEARSARVAASFLPLYGPLPPDTDFVRSDKIIETSPMTIEDQLTVQLATLQVKVELRGPQIADPALSSALQLFRRAANVLARLEDLVVFRGLDTNLSIRQGAATPAVAPPPGSSPITSGDATEGLWFAAGTLGQDIEMGGGLTGEGLTESLGKPLVTSVSEAILKLEEKGHFGPFAAVLGHGFFNAVQTPDRSSLVLPQDRIIPFLGGGSLLRSSALNQNTGVVVALGGAPVDLVVARDMSLDFLTVTSEPKYLFRVSEKIVLRIKQPQAICKLELVPLAYASIDLAKVETDAKSWSVELRQAALDYELSHLSRKDIVDALEKL